MIGKVIYRMMMREREREEERVKKSLDFIEGENNWTRDEKKGKKREKEKNKKSINVETAVYREVVYQAGTKPQ